MKKVNVFLNVNLLALFLGKLFLWGKNSYEIVTENSSGLQKNLLIRRLYEFLLIF